MFATQKNISDTPINTHAKLIANKYIIYPDFNGKRIAEGGLRTKGKYKKSLPDKPLLSVITVVYNGVNTLEKCMCSVLNQNYDNVEYIVIDGGSVDGTLRLIKEYEDSIDYFISEPDTGIYDAMNKGISLASGDVINFMNSDDNFVENVFAEYVLIIKTKDIVAVNAKIKMIYEHQTPIKTFSYPTESNFFNCITVHQTFFIKKEVFNELGYFNTEYKIAGDYCFLLSMFMHFGKELVATLDKITVHFYSGGCSSVDSITTFEEVVKAQYDCYGQQLQIPETFFMNILNSKDVAKHNPLSLLFNLYINTKNSVNEILWKQVLKAFYVFLEQGIHKEYCYLIKENERLLDDFWFQFGQQNKRNKIILLFKKLMQKVAVGRLNKHDKN